MPTDKVAMPVTVTIIIMCLYIFGGAALFSYWEDWDFPSSVYFTWVIKYLEFVIVECVEIFRINKGTVRLSETTKKNWGKVSLFFTFKSGKLSKFSFFNLGKVFKTFAMHLHMHQNN